MIWKNRSFNSSPQFFIVLGRKLSLVKAKFSAGFHAKFPKRQQVCSGKYLPISYVLQVNRMNSVSNILLVLRKSIGDS